MNYKFRLVALLSIDSIVVLFSIFLAHFFLNPFDPTVDLMLVLSSVILLLSHHIFCFYFHIYHRVWKYANIDELISLCEVIVISIIITAVSQLIIFNTLYERGLFLTLILHLVLLCGIRLFWRFFQLRKEDIARKSISKKKATLILGAGISGRNITNELLRKESNLNPVVFLDDNPKLKNLEINGIPVVGSLQDLEAVVEYYKIKHIIIAIPSFRGEKLQQIIQRSKRACEDVQLLPKYRGFATGELSYSKFRDVSIEDLLGREPVNLNNEIIYAQIKDSVVLVTGAGGSIGSELCRQLINYNPKELILIDQSEFNIFQIMNDLNKINSSTKVKAEILNIENRKRVFMVFEKYKPKMVFHAAAYKHVPLMEKNIYSAVATNIFGTNNVADASQSAAVENFILISSDKAVNPKSVMGVTKRIAELIVNGKNKNSETKYAIVRFGNVLGSSGSVIPIFKQQIKNGGPITITHPDMTRYFMTIPEATQLVIQATSYSNGGETFVLNMGEPIKITELAKKLIHLSGFTEEEISIVYTGIRPGEKIHEELFYMDEQQYEQIHSKIFVLNNNQYIENIDYLYKSCLFLNESELHDLLKKLINEETQFIPERLIQI